MAPARDGSLPSQRHATKYNYLRKNTLRSSKHQAALRRQMTNISLSPDLKSPELTDRHQFYNKLNAKLRAMRAKRVRNYGVGERKWQLSGHEVQVHMEKLVEGIKQHGKEFEEMTKISSVDTIRLRNSKI